MRRTSLIVLTTTTLLATPAFAAVSLDSTFSGDGKLKVGTPDEDWFSDVAIEGTDIIAVGNYGGMVMVSRYEEDGDLVTSFGNNGRRLVEIGRQSSGLALEMVDGQPVAAARTPNGFAVIRLTADGDLDSSFGGDGIVRRETQPYTYLSFAVDSNDRPVVGFGEYTKRGVSESRIHLYRFLDSGAADAGFGTDGELKFRPYKRNTLNGLDIDSTDQILIAVTPFGADDPRAGMSVIRVSEDGDTALLVRRASLWEKDGTFPVGLSIGADDTITVGATGATSARVGAIRLTSTGNFDSSFSADGRVARSCSRNCGVSGQTLGPDGELYLVGGVDDNDKGRIFDDTWIARINTTGQFDHSFGNDGQRIIDIFNGVDIAIGATVDGSGRIVLAGLGSNDIDGYLARVEYS